MKKNRYYFERIGVFVFKESGLYMNLSPIALSQLREEDFSL
jgi:hypothetical protein